MPNKKPFLSTHRTYSHDESSTYVKNGSKFAIQYGSGPVSGAITATRLLAGDVEVKSYLFAEVDDTSGLGVGQKVGQVRRHFGPGLAGHLRGRRAHAAAGHGPVPRRAGLRLRSATRRPANWCWAASDSTKYAEADHVPLQSKTYWEIKLEGLAVGAANMTRATRAIVDSGTSLLAGPKDDVKRVAKAAGAKPALAGEYTIACDAKAPDITFVLGGRRTTSPSRTTSSRSRPGASSA